MTELMPSLETGVLVLLGITFIAAFVNGADIMLDGGASAGFTQRMISAATGLQVPS